ncbi:MAG: hypothetical protein GY805_11275 [Chloroflexi bacterium]|nr:hypothetical protein [Chloroflexota bacterium]
MKTAEDLKVWLVVGLVPYRIRKRHLPGGLRQIEVRALFWTCVVKQRPSGRHDWTVQIPLIEKLRQGVWTAVMLWQSNALPEDGAIEEESG